MFARGIAYKSLQSGRQAAMLKIVQAPVRTFRNDFINPYMSNPIKLSEAERTTQDALPVWERAFDFKKYMEHDGPLKVLILALI